MTEAETILWKRLRNHQFHGLQFRRQYPIGNKYILDFYCPEMKLAIEIDGSIHNDAEIKDNDAYRTESLNSKDIKILRFSNEDILRDLSNVLQKIKTEMDSPSPR